MTTSLFRKRYFIAILTAFVSLLAYSNTFTVPFQFDDDAYVVNNPTLRTFHYFIHPSEITALGQQSPTSFPIALRSAFMTRIVGHLSLAINYHLHGLHVVGYHVVNLMIHILNGILVYLILMATLKTEYFSSFPFTGTFAPRAIIPVACSLLFVTHPIQTQAVTYISQRFTVLAAFFYLLSLLLYIRFRTSPPSRKRSAYYAVGLGSAVAAMLTKEFTFTLPIIIALFEITFFSGNGRNRIRTLIPFAAALLIIPVLIFIQQGTWNALDSTMRSMTAADETNISRINYLLTQFRIIILYIRLLFFPINQNVDHDATVYHSLFALPVFSSFIALLALFSLGVYLYYAGNRQEEYPELKLASFGVIYFFITLSVESSFIPLGELTAEYRLYLPSIGIIIAFVSLVVFTGRRSSRP
jgi:protein O-mannosyl-transferase